MYVDRKDLWAGAVFVGVAALYGGIAWFTLPVGQTFSMGPGYFPLVLSSLLGLVGLVLVIRALVQRTGDGRRGDPLPWRPILAISAALIFFGALLREVGVFLAVFVTVFVSSLAADKVKPLNAAVLSLALSVFCIAVFIYGVRLPLPILGSWFTD